MVNNNMTNVDDIKDKMIRDLDKYDKDPVIKLANKVYDNIKKK